ncbi:hypothetical protein OIU85_026624 [Salix viminalis]|uniref:Uncharacterized protein n=1 Tax=Salix viminalis TaxID=40686 RepID=A0A9Q0TNV9_SALVM|nr:hypothetical protein OIU85_026624 [Salix viminalis]
MEALQVISSATEIISSMVGAVSALDQAYRNLDEAPKRIRSLEEFVYDLENLTRGIRQKHVYKLHNPQLDHQIQSLNALIEQLRPNIAKARRIVSRSRMKNLAKVVWSSVAGDPLSKLINTIRDDLNWWLESQRLTQHVQKKLTGTRGLSTGYSDCWGYLVLESHVWLDRLLPTLLQSLWVEQLRLDLANGAVEMPAMETRMSTIDALQEKFQTFWYRLVSGRRLEMKTMEILIMSAVFSRKRCTERALSYFWMMCGSRI